MSDAPQPSMSFGSRLVAAVTVIAVHFVTLILLLVVLLSVAPKYILLFEHFNVDLPNISLQVLLLSNFATRYWWLIAPLAMAIDAALVALHTFAFQRKSLLSIYSHVWLLAVIVLLVWISIGLAAPIPHMTGN